MQARLAAFLEIIQAVATLRQTSVSRSTSVPQTSVALPSATGQVTSAFCALSAVGLIARHLRELIQLTQLTPYSWEPSIALCPSPSVLSGNSIDNTDILNADTMGVGDKGKKGGKQIIKKK